MICRRMRCPTVMRNCSVVRFGWGIVRNPAQAALAQFLADRQRHTAIVHETFRSLFYHPETSALLAAVVAAAEGHSRRSPSRPQKQTGPAGPPPDRSSTAKKKRKP